MSELANSLDESLFTASSPAVVALTTLHDVRKDRAPFVREALVSAQTKRSSRHAGVLHLLHCALVDRDSQLLFTAVIDAPGRQNLAEILIDHKEILDPVWRQCEGYPGSGIEDPAGIAQFLRAGCERTQLVYSGYPDATGKEIRRALDWMRKTMHFQIELAKSPKNAN